VLIRGYRELKKFIEENKILHFEPEEFTCRHCGHVVIDSELVKFLEKMRVELERPVIITSAYRCPRYNEQIGGVPGSAHTRGLAVDIFVVGNEHRYEFLNYLLKHGVKRIGIANDFIHFDFDYEKPHPRIWVYTIKRHVA